VSSLGHKSIPFLEISGSYSVKAISTYGRDAGEDGEAPGSPERKVALVLDCFKSPRRGHVSMGLESGLANVVNEHVAHCLYGADTTKLESDMVKSTAAVKRTGICGHG
jgi:hypothetical protein